MQIPSKLWAPAALLVVTGHIAGFVYWDSQLLRVENVPQADVGHAIAPDNSRSISASPALFGAVQETEKAATGETIKESQLSLKLFASYVVPEKNRSAAIISSDGDNQKLYYIGDKIQQGVELKAVQADRILVKRNGVLESISLEGVTEQDVALVKRKAPTPLETATTVPEAPSVKPDLAEKLKKLKALAARDN